MSFSCSDVCREAINLSLRCLGIDKIGSSPVIPLENIINTCVEEAEGEEEEEGEWSDPKGEFKPPAIMLNKDMLYVPPRKKENEYRRKENY